MSSDSNSVNTDSNSVAFGRTVVPVVNRNKEPKKDKLGAEYAEHCFIGDAITLTLANGEKVAASDYKFQLKDQLSLTYGQINGLAGDFYGTYKPISDGRDDQDRSIRFVDAYNTLADGGYRQPKEAMEILAVLQTEVDAVNNALANHQDPSVAYSKLPSFYINAKLELITWGRSDIPGYAGLAQINWDHFGADARIAYNAGHATALQLAISGDLDGAYAMNAFADHFLEDSFSAGHLRTPRRYLHRSLNFTADICAEYMHDEDNAIGLSVQNPGGQSWTAYGDKRALDTEDEDNLNRCVDAVQASADEIYQAYHAKTAPSPADYKAWTHAPTLESARAHQTLATLFTFQKERRKDIENRRMWEFKTDWSFLTTAAECKLSGWWNYPITINGPSKVLPWSSVAVITPVDWHMHLFYQIPGGGIVESEYLGGPWTGGSNGAPIFKAVLFTPLAAIQWNDGKEIRIYYLDEQYILQEFCFSADKGFYPGALGQLNIQAATNSSLAAFQIDDGDQIRVYCQVSDSNAITEIVDGDLGWYTATHDLLVALSGSGLAVVANKDDKGIEVHLYYQADDLSLKEHFFDGSDWSSGDFNPGTAPGCVPISAIGWNDGSLKLNVYWRNLVDEIVGTSYTDSWGPIDTIVKGLKPGTQFAATQWGDGAYLRLYYQARDDSVLEICNDQGSWLGGANVGNAR